VNIPRVKFLTSSIFKKLVKIILKQKKLKKEKQKEEEEINFG